MFDFGEIVAGVGFRISIDRIIVENAYDLRHVEIPLIWRRNRKCFVESAVAGARRRNHPCNWWRNRDNVFRCRGVDPVLQQKRTQRSLVSAPTQPWPAMMGRGFLL